MDLEVIPMRRVAKIIESETPMRKKIRIRGPKTKT